MTDELRRLVASWLLLGALRIHAGQTIESALVIVRTAVKRKRAM